jgi:hypothetical protein
MAIESTFTVDIPGSDARHCGVGWNYIDEAEFAGRPFHIYAKKVPYNQAALDALKTKFITAREAERAVRAAEADAVTLLETGFGAD